MELLGMKRQTTSWNEARKHSVSPTANIGEAKSENQIMKECSPVRLSELVKKHVCGSQIPMNVLGHIVGLRSSNCVHVDSDKSLNNFQHISQQLSPRQTSAVCGQCSLLRHQTPALSVIQTRAVANATQDTTEIQPKIKPKHKSTRVSRHRFLDQPAPQNRNATKHNQTHSLNHSTGSLG